MSVGSTSISAVVPDTVFATHFMAVLRLPDSTHIQNQMQKMLPIATALLDEGASACCTRGRAGGVTFSVFTILKMSCPPISQQNKVFPENLKGGPQSSVRVTLPCHSHSRGGSRPWPTSYTMTSNQPTSPPRRCSLLPAARTCLF